MIPYKEALQDIKQYNYSYYQSRKKGRLLKCNDIFCFDVETTSVFNINGNWTSFDVNINEDIYNESEKLSFVYIWQFSINDDIRVYGRTLEEFEEFIYELSPIVKTPFTIWIQNLAYEFQYLRNIFGHMEVFARKNRKPMKFNVDIMGCDVEFRCSYILSQLSLARLGELYSPPSIQKMVGDLDYTKMIRTPLTILTDKEMTYCENDVRCLFYAIRHYLNKYEVIDRIPLTHTGEVRLEMQKTFKGDRKYNNYCKDLVPSVREYVRLHECFGGGYTHANAIYVDMVLTNVKSVDFASSYPFVLVTEKFPCTHFLQLSPFYTDLEFVKLNYPDDDFAKMYRVKLNTVSSKNTNHYLSYSKCFNVVGAIVDNGRIADCISCELWCTEIDLQIIIENYNVEVELLECWVAKKDYLNIKYVNLILTYYSGKTELKGVKGNEDLYADYKTYINSLYGMQVTNNVAPDVTFDNNGEYEDWNTGELTRDIIEDKLNKERNNYKNLTVYSNGIWVTAYARRNLWRLIHSIGLDVVYCDTDSVKYIGNHDDIIENYNNDVMETIARVSNERGIDISLFTPKNPKGIECPIGIAENEGVYDEFITQGAKKYAYKKDGKISITVSGLNKIKAMGKGTPIKSLDDFRDNTVFDYNHSGRLIMSYEDCQPVAIIDGYTIDYRFGIVARPTTYTLGKSVEYDRYIHSANLEHEKINLRGFIE